MLTVPSLLALAFVFAGAAAASAGKHEVSTSGLRANAKANANQDDRRTNAVTPDRYWVAPIKNSGLTCIDNSIRAGGGKPLEVCLTEGEALCIEYDYKPMGGRWQFGIEDSKLRLYDPRGQVAYEYCRDVTHLCIGEEHGFHPNRYSKERPYLTLYDEKIHEVVGSLTCDGTDGKNDENIGQSTILKLVDQADVGPYADYPLTVVKFKKGQTEDPKDDNSLWNITVGDPISTATGLELESFLQYNADRCEWKSYVDSFEELKRQIAAATDPDPDNRAKIEICEDMPIVFDSDIDFSEKYFELSCLGTGCVFDLNGHSFVTPDPSAFHVEVEGIAIENGSSTVNSGIGLVDLGGGTFFVFGVSEDESRIAFRDCIFRNNAAWFGGAIFSISASLDIHNCNFEDNSARYSGGAIFGLGGKINVQGGLFMRNGAEYGGATYFISRLRYQFRNARFIGNSAVFGGGAIYGDIGNNGNIYGCSFEDNIAQTYDGGAIDNLPVTNVLDSTFKNNSATGRFSRCGAMCASVTNLRGCRFESNYATFDGGAISGGTLENVQGCHFKDNKAEIGTGGAIRGQVINLHESQFEGNEAGVGGGALHMRRPPESLNVTSCRFSGNSAEYGGAIELFDITTMSMEDVEFRDNTASNAGGAINFYGSDASCCAIRTMQLNACKFEGNAAAFGGAIFSYRDSYTLRPSYLQVEGSNFTGNKATNSGGAIRTYNTETSIGQSTFVCNSADFAAGAIHHEDDDPYNYLPGIGEPTPISIADTHFVHNGAALGGALLIESAPSSIDRCTWEQNSAFLSGGAIVVSDTQNSSPANSTHNMTENVFQGNTLTAGFGTSVDIFTQDSDGGSTYNCGHGYDNCFCDANPAELPKISTIGPTDTCQDAGIPPSCTCTPPTPTMCPFRNRVGAMTRAENDGPHDTEDLLKTLHEKQEVMFKTMLLRLNSTDSSSLAADDDKRSGEEEKLDTILEKYGMKAHP